ncbi:MAG: peroxiredoxin-like family protein [Pseudomonadota bacterium]
MTIRPRELAPDLNLPTAGGDSFVLSAQKPDSFTMLVVYRGLHCPICKNYLADLNQRADEFAALGVIPAAVSSDTAERATEAKNHWELDRLTVAYGMSIAEGREWGLSVSRAISDKEPAEFLEPGIFLIRPDRTLYAASVQTMPFARPSFADIAGAIKFVTGKNYPARGEA